MRKNKGYQKDVHSKRRPEIRNSYPAGTNKTPEQIMADVNRRFDERIEDCKKEYAKIYQKTTLVGEDLHRYCRNWLLWEVRFDDEGNLLPMEEAIALLEKNRQRYIGRCLYHKYGGYQKRIIHKDNQKFVYNSGSGADCRNWIRIPSMKRSVATWKRFYELFPNYKEHYNELNNKNGIKLKKVW